MPDIIPMTASSSVETSTTDLEMVSVPKYIHFFWMGDTLPKKYVDIVQDMAEKASSSYYQVILWTDENSLSIFTDFNSSYPEIQLSTHNYHSLLTKCLISNDSYHRNAARQINAILAAGKEDGAKPNYSAISDIFRILILDIEGGFYNDTDNYIFESTGPMGELRVTKALGYKILVMFRNVGDVNVSCINGSMIASLPKSKLTRAALMKIEKTYIEGIIPPLAHQVFASWDDFITQMQHPSSETERAPNILPYNKETLDLERTDIAYWLTRWNVFANMGEKLRPAVRAELKENQPKTPEDAAIHSRLRARVYYGIEYGPGMLQDIHNSFPENLRNLSVFHGGFITPSTGVADGQDGTWYKNNKELVSISFQATIVKPALAPALLHEIIFYKKETAGLELIKKQQGLMHNHNPLFSDEEIIAAFEEEKRNKVKDRADEPRIAIYGDLDVSTAATSDECISPETYIYGNYEKITCELSIDTDLTEYDPIFKKLITEFNHHPLAPLAAEMYLAFHQLYRYGGLYISSRHRAQGDSYFLFPRILVDATYGFKITDFNSITIACLPKNHRINKAKMELLIFIEEKIFKSYVDNYDVLEVELHKICQMQINQFDGLSETRRAAMFFSEKEINSLFNSRAREIIKLENEQRFQKLEPEQAASTHQTFVNDSTTPGVSISDLPARPSHLPASSTETSSCLGVQYGSLWSSSMPQRSDDADYQHSTHTISLGKPPSK